MKTVILALVITIASVFADKLKTEPLTTTDVASILNISATRYLLTFSSKEPLVYQYETQGSPKQITDIGFGDEKSLSVVVYEENVYEQRSLGFMLYSSKGSSKTFFRAARPHTLNPFFQQTSFEKNVFTVIGSLDKDFSSFLYRIQILPKSQTEQKNAK